MFEAWEFWQRDVAYLGAIFAKSVEELRFGLRPKRCYPAILGSPHSFTVSQPFMTTFGHSWGAIELRYTGFEWLEFKLQFPGMECGTWRVEFKGLRSFLFVCLLACLFVCLFVCLFYMLCFCFLLIPAFFLVFLCVFLFFFGDVKHDLV